MYEELTVEQEEKMKALVGKYNFNDLRLFLKKLNLQLVIGNNCDMLDYDLFKYNFAPKRYYAVYDQKKYNSVLSAMEILDNIRHKRYVNELPVDMVANAKKVAEEFADFLMEPVKKLIKNYEKSQEFFDYAKLFATYHCTFDAEKLEILKETGEPGTLIYESTTEWQKYLKELDVKKQANKELEL